MKPDLNGLRVLNTRPTGQAESLSVAIRKANGVSIELPTILIEPTSNEWISHLPNLSTIKHAIFISVNAVNYFFKELKKRHIQWNQNINVSAVGNATANALKVLNIDVHHVPPHANSEDLLQLGALKKVKNQRILLVKGEGGRVLIEDTLLERGANVIDLLVYRRVLPKIHLQDIHSLWREDQVDIILFTSQLAMSNIFTLFGEPARSWLCMKPCLVISKRLAKEASLLGMQTIFVSSYNSIVNDLIHYQQGLIYDNKQ